MKKIILFCCIFITAVLAKKEGMSIVIIGDSNTEEGYITHSLTDSLLAYVGVPASTGTGYIPIYSGFYEVRDGRVPNVTISYPNTWTLMDMFEGTRLPPPYLSPSGHWLKSSTVGAVATVAFPGNGVDVYWLSDVNGGKFSISIDDAAKDTLNTKGPRSVQKTNIKGLTSGNHTMQLTVLSVPANGNVTLLGFDGHNDTAGITKRSVVHNWGNGYCASIDFMKIDSVVFATGLQKLAPDIVAVLLGTNDHLQDRRSAADFEANLIVILNRIKAAGFEGRILLVSTHMTHTSDGSGAEFIPQYRATSWPQAATKTGVAYWDMSTWLGDDDSQWMTWDGCHFNQDGGKHIASEFLRQLITRFPVVVGTTPWHKSVVAAGSAGAFKTEVKGGRMTLSFADPATVNAVTVMNLNGATLRRFGSVAGTLSIDLRDLPKSVVFVKVEWIGNGVDRAAVKRVPLF